MKLHLKNQNIRNEAREENTRPGSVGTISSDPILLAQLGLVLVVSDHVLLQITRKFDQKSKVWLGDLL